MKHNIVKSCNLNQAALYVAIGAKLIHINSHQPQWEFLLSIKPWHIWYEKHFGFVPYRKFCGIRVSLKDKVYTQEGRNRNFRGKDQGFLFNDVVRVTHWTDRERQQLQL